MNDYHAENFDHELSVETTTDWRLVAYTSLGLATGSLLSSIIWASLAIVQVLT